MARIIETVKCPVFYEAGNIKVTTEFGNNIPDYPTKGKTGNHYGIDIVRALSDYSSATATITAYDDGIIYAQRKWVEGYNADFPAGNCVYIKHNDGLITKYYHLACGSVPNWVKDGATVKRNDIIGFMGSTGYSFGAHLHFQVETPEGIPINPEPYLTGEITPTKTVYIVLSTFTEFVSAFDSAEKATKEAEKLNKTADPCGKMFYVEQIKY